MNDDRMTREGLSEEPARLRCGDLEIESGVRSLREAATDRTQDLFGVNEQAAIFRRFVEASEQGFGISSLEGYIEYVNSAMCRILGERRPEDVVGRYLGEYAVDKEGAAIVREHLATVVKEGKWLREGAVRCRNGCLRPVFRSSFLIRDEQGRPTHLAAVITDISEYKHVEEVLRKERRTLQHLLQSSDHERRQIAYEIHDGLAQELAGAIMHFDSYRHLQETGEQDKASAAFDRAMAMLRTGHFEARRLINRVRPPILDESGVVDAIAHMVHEEDHGLGPQIEFFSRVGFDRLAPALENAVYRIAHEAVLNAAKHSHSEKVRIELVEQDKWLSVSVQDWGRGFDVGSDGNGRYGLDGIRERARLLGGTCTIESEPGKGSRVTVQLPLVFKE